MLKAVLFDLDDTLLDWSGFKSDWATMEALHLSRVVEFLRAEGHDFHDAQAYTAEFRSRTTAAWASARTSLRAPNLGNVLVEAAIALGVPVGAIDARRCLEAFQWAAVEGTTLFPECPEVLRLLHDNGIKVGIVTNAYQPMWLRDIEIEFHGILNFFPDCRISAADVGYLKPHPAIFQAALNCCGAKADETVFVGDDVEADVAGAQAAGLLAVLRETRRSQSRLGGAIVPDATIKSLTDLPPLLDEWFHGWRR
jgi:putative hydrolase of the HAD superfamily